MKAAMSDKLRDILRDPKTNEELRKGISHLSSETKQGKPVAEITIGGHAYKIKFVSQNSKSE